MLQRVRGVSVTCIPMKRLGKYTSFLFFPSSSFPIIQEEREKKRWRMSPLCHYSDSTYGLLLPVTGTKGDVTSLTSVPPLSSPVSIWTEHQLASLPRQNKVPKCNQHFIRHTYLLAPTVDNNTLVLLCGRRGEVDNEVPFVSKGEKCLVYLYDWCLLCMCEGK